MVPAQRPALRAPEPHQEPEAHPLPLLLHRLRQAATLRLPRRRHVLRPAGAVLQRRVRAERVLRDVRPTDCILRAGNRSLLPVGRRVPRCPPFRRPHLLPALRLPVRPPRGVLRPDLRPRFAPLHRSRFGLNQRPRVIPSANEASRRQANRSTDGAMSRDASLLGMTRFLLAATYPTG